MAMRRAFSADGASFSGVSRPAVRPLASSDTYHSRALTFRHITACIKWRMSQSTKAAKRAGDLLLKSVELEREAEEGPPATVDIDAIKSPVRQEILFYVDEEEAPIRLESLAEHLVDWEMRTSSGDRERMHVLLHHKHLPQLVDAGLVEYDQAERMVALTAYAERLLNA